MWLQYTRQMGRRDVEDHENITLAEKTQGDLISMLIFPPPHENSPRPQPEAFLQRRTGECAFLLLRRSRGSFAASRLAGQPGFNLVDHTDANDSVIFVRATGNRIRAKWRAPFAIGIVGDGEREPTTELTKKKSSASTLF